MPIPGKIVFGIKCRSTGLSLIFPVQNKTKETLIPIIVNHVAGGATVISDKFSSYITRQERSHSEEVGFEHFFVNHSLNFVDPIQSFIHTNNIERTWRSLRASISHIKRSPSDEVIDSFIDTFHFQTFFKEEDLYNIFLEILVIVSKM